MSIDIEFTMTKLPGPVAITFAADRLISLKLRDAATGVVISDMTGDKAVPMSALLANLPEDTLDELAAKVGIETLRVLAAGGDLGG